MRTVLKWEAGFTVIEMMVVLVFISTLALIATLSLGSSTAKPHPTAMLSDLRNVATAQEAYIEQHFAENGTATYASDIGELDVNLSNGVQIRLRGNRNGWSARATHDRVSGRRCSIVRGTIKPFPPASTAEEGKIICD